jgi:hypothetical protein
VTVELIELPSYAEDLAVIFDFLDQQDPEGTALQAFSVEHGRVLTFIRDNPETPAVHPVTGDQSWPFGDGRYRLFFKRAKVTPDVTRLYMVHVIDNRRANVAVYPNNRMPGYEVEE